MQKLAILLILLCVSSSLFAQEGSLSLGGYITYEDLDAEFEGFRFTNLEEFQFEALYGLGIGGRAQYLITDAVSLRLGLAYMYRRYQYTFTGISGPTDPLTPAYVNHHIHLVSVPIQLGYAIVNGERFKLIQAAGINIGIGLADTQTIFNQDGSIRQDKQGVTRLEGLTASTFSGLLSVEFQFYLSSSLFVALDPYFQYVLFDDVDGTIFYKMKRYGATLSVNYRI